MAVKTSWSSGDVLTAADLTDTFAAKPTKTSGTTAPSTPATGDIWYDTNSTPPAAKFYDGSAWQGFSNGLPLLGGWATISTTPTGSYTDADGDWDYWHYTANGTLTVTDAGLLDVLIIGSGTSWNDTYGGNPGNILFGVHAVPSGALTVTVGAAHTNGNGNLSSLGSLYPQIAILAYATGNAVGVQGTTIGDYTGYTSAITGTSLVYGRAHQASPRANSGDGGANTVSVPAGVVIVRRPA